MRKCDICGKKATKFSSPLGNSDEVALCDECFRKWRESRPINPGACVVNDQDAMRSFPIEDY